MEPPPARVSGERREPDAKRFDPDGSESQSHRYRSSEGTVKTAVLVLRGDDLVYLQLEP
jgi:hypothetical protein